MNRVTEEVREVMSKLTEVVQVGKDPDNIIDEIHGLVDTPSTSLSRIPGKILCCTGIMDGPVWNIFQLRFRDSVGSYLHDGPNLKVSDRRLPSNGARFPYPEFDDDDNPSRDTPPFPWLPDWPEDYDPAYPLAQEPWFYPVVPITGWTLPAPYHWIRSGNASIYIPKEELEGYDTFLIKVSDWPQKLGCYVRISWVDKDWTDNMSVYHLRSPDIPEDQWYWESNRIDNGEIAALSMGWDEDYDDMIVVRVQKGALTESHYDTIMTFQAVATPAGYENLTNPDGSLIRDTSGVTVTIGYPQAGLDTTNPADFWFLVGLGTSDSKTCSVSNTGEEGSLMDWAGVLNVPAALAGKVLASPLVDTGLQKDQSSTITVTVDSTGVPEGTYDCSIDITATDQNDRTLIGSIEFTVEVVGYDASVNIASDVSVMTYTQTVRVTGYVLKLFAPFTYDTPPYDNTYVTVLGAPRLWANGGYQKIIQIAPYPFPREYLHTRDEVIELAWNLSGGVWAGRTVVAIVVSYTKYDSGGDAQLTGNQIAVNSLSSNPQWGYDASPPACTISFPHAPVITSDIEIIQGVGSGSWNITHEVSGDGTHAWPCGTTWGAAGGLMNVTAVTVYYRN